VDADKTIKPEAIRRTLDAISSYCAICGEVGVERIRLATTSAVRDARNRDTFLGAAGEIAGVEPEILDGVTEARLSFDGAVSDLNPGTYVICDIGGGSTELFVGSVPKAAQGTVGLSINIGSVRLTERHIHGDPPTDDELDALAADLSDALGAADELMPPKGEASLIGVAGTVTSLAALHLGLKAYDPNRTHHSRLSRRKVEELSDRLSRLPLRAREKLSGMPPGRADVIVAGARILLGVMERWSFNEVIVSERDILDGLVLEMIESLENS
jgi:exopolyphosphatase/guanosine-5'-triphosphate,3'-diphosphate pyrophosphatase